MKLLVDDPPHNIRQLCEEAFNLEGCKPIWTYGATVYNPYNMPLDRSQVAHEQIHSQQQGEKPAEWWWKYLDDEKFRFDQEVEAYRVQFKIMQEDLKDRNQLFRMLTKIATDLASDQYGRLCTLTEARRLIKDVV